LRSIVIVAFAQSLSCISIVPVRCNNRSSTFVPIQSHLFSILQMATPTPLLTPKTFHISGIVVDVYGLDELPPSCELVSCLWLLHGRLQSKEVMAETASTCIRHWNQSPAEPSSRTRGLLCVSFDQRNHGTRQTNALANQTWKENENHAVDMYW
jgi:hypothetical protein